MSQVVEDSLLPETAPLPAATFVRALEQTGFSAEGYRNAYDDLAALDLDAPEALLHFLRYGIDERRPAPLELNRQALVALAGLPMRDCAFKARLLSNLARHLFDAVDHPFGPPLVDRWPAIQALASHGGCPYFVAGDSHSNQYALMGARDDAWLLPIPLLCTAGSARGLSNPASRSGYGAHLRHAVQVVQTLPGASALPFLLQFGQVDIEFVYHYLRARQNRRMLDLDDYRMFCDATLARYIQFVTGLFTPAQRLGVFLVSVFPPAVSDAAWCAGYDNADIAWREDATSATEQSAAIRELQIADLPQRTAVHAHFNAGLRAACRQHGFRYIDGFTPFLGTDGLVDPRYLVAEMQGAEHHLDGRATYDPIVELVWRCIDAMRAQRICPAVPAPRS